MKQNLYKFLILSALTLGVGVIFTPSSAKAALPGEDGVLVSTELQSEPDSESSNTAVVTTNPETGSSQVIATGTPEVSAITSATVSAPVGTSPSNQTNTVMYAETALSCVNEEEFEKLDKSCNQSQTVTYNSVKIDVNGAKVSDITPVATVGAEDNLSTNIVLDMSYSPDGTNAIATRYTRSHSEGGSEATRIERVGVDGTVTNVINPTNDGYLNAGYGANGNIYFSMTHAVGDGEFPSYNSDLFMIEAGKTYTDRIQITDTPDYDEVFINVAPDVSKVLVYSFGNNEEYPSSYSYVNLANTCWLTAAKCSVDVLLPTSNSDTYLATFSPKGTRLAGVDDPEYSEEYSFTDRVGVQQDSDLSLYDTVMANVTHNLRTTSVIYGQFARDIIPQVDWAPKLAVATTVENPITTTASVVTPSTTARLANTGVNSYIFVAIAVLFVAAGVAALPKNN